MTSLQKSIYDYIAQHGVVNCQELCKVFHFKFDEDSEKRNLSRKSLPLYKEIEQINSSFSAPTIIVWDVKSNYWLAKSKEEAEAFVMRLYKKPALTKLAKMYLLVRKAKRNGQGSLFDENLVENETLEFIKSFADDLSVEEEIARLEAENEEIDFDENKYTNGRYMTLEENLKRIAELKKGAKTDACENNL